jgi:antitoxin (DNA-binding transcriptional repressor) of toxin-antitoxin stability system
MKTVQIPLEETGPLAAALKNGQSVELMDGDERIATVIPRPSAEERKAMEERIEELIRTGRARRGPQTSLGSLVEDLIADRRRD